MLQRKAAISNLNAYSGLFEVIALMKFYIPALFAVLALLHSVTSARSEDLLSNVALRVIDGKIDTTVTWPRKSAYGATVTLDLRVATDTSRLRSEGARVAIAFPFQSH